MKVLAYCALHYGQEWLEWTIRSVIDFVDEYHVFYTPHPSHGTRTDKSLPDGEDRETLRAIALSFDDVVWHDVTQFYQEGDHRDYCVNVLSQMGADLILWQDADEIWDPDVLSDAMDWVMARDYRDNRVHAMHFWKGLNWVCYDECMPVRFIKPGAGQREGYVPGRGFYHMGYAQSAMLIQYKMTIHGHRAELKRNWFPVYRDWKGPEDTPECGVHPTNGCDDKTHKPFWNPVPFVRFDIEHLVGDHPYFVDELI